MLYTFTVTESQLAKIDRYLSGRWGLGDHQYILGVQPHLTDDLVFVVVDCTEDAAIYISLLI